jgi:hypothetical protein
LSTHNKVVYSAHDYGPDLFHQNWFNSNTSTASLLLGAERQRHIRSAGQQLRCAPANLLKQELLSGIQFQLEDRDTGKSDDEVR